MSAQTPLSAGRLSAHALLRRGWVIPLAMLAVAAVALAVAKIRTQEATAESIVLVNSKPGPIGPGAATEASRLALTYAAIVPKDSNILQAVSRAIDEPTSKVRKRFSAVNPTDTAVLRLRFRDDDPAVAATGARAATQALAGLRPASPTIGPGTVQIVRLAPVPGDPSDDAPVAIGIGLVLGFALGVILLLAWDRADPRIDSPADVFARAMLPATEVDRLTPTAAATLVERWARDARDRPVRVIVIPVSKKMERPVEAVARYLESTNGAAEVDAVGCLGTDGEAEALALTSDIRVVLVARGDRENELESALQLLEQYDAPASWVLIARHPRKLGDRFEAEAPAKPARLDEPRETAELGAPGR
jgi:capsular polysaccharide biosynthesis protein